MAIVLGPNQYGKAETHLVRVYRDTPRHQIRDLLVSTSLRGDFEAAHITGDQAAVLPTDTQKNTVFAFAREHGVGEIEDYALLLARHFVADIEPVSAARIEVAEHEWDRIEVDGQGHDHAFARSDSEVRTTTVTVESGGVHVESGLRDLTILKSSGSEFQGFLRDRYTTLADASDRILATSLVARWRYLTTEVEWAGAYAAIRATLLERFATTHSRALQHTLWEMGRGTLEAHTEVAEIHLSAPNKHHFAVDLTPFGLSNPGEVFYAADRPYGLIEAAVQRSEDGGAGAEHPVWSTIGGFV
jgi:urate oxidase